MARSRLSSSIAQTKKLCRCCFCMKVKLSSPGRSCLELLKCSFWMTDQLCGAKYGEVALLTPTGRGGTTDSRLPTSEFHPAFTESLWKYPACSTLEQPYYLIYERLLRSGFFAFTCPEHKHQLYPNVSISRPCT